MHIDQSPQFQSPVLSIKVGLLDLNVYYPKWVGDYSMTDMLISSLLQHVLMMEVIHCETLK